MGHHTPSSLSLDCPLTSPVTAQRGTLANGMGGGCMLGAVASLLSQGLMKITEDPERNKVGL